MSEEKLFAPEVIPGGCVMIKYSYDQKNDSMVFSFNSYDATNNNAPLNAGGYMGVYQAFSSMLMDNLPDILPWQKEMLKKVVDTINAQAAIVALKATKH